MAHVAAIPAKILKCSEIYFQRVTTRDMHWHGIPNGTGNPMGMAIKHRIENGNVREWETTSVGMGITCTPMGIYSEGFMLR